MKSGFKIESKLNQTIRIAKLLPDLF